MGGDAPALFMMAEGMGQRFDQFYEAQQRAGMGGAAGFFAALNVAGDMVGVNAVIGGSFRQDLATGAPLSNAEGNAQVIVGAFSLATTFTGAGAAGAAGKAGSVAKGTGAASKGTAAAAGGTAKTIATKVVTKTDSAAKNRVTACTGNPSGCFVAGTLVATANGDKPIESLREGDLVLARDEFTGNQGFRPVQETLKRHVAELVHLRLHREGRAKGSAWRGARQGGGESGDSDPDSSLIVGTDEHPFWSTDSDTWIPMGKLRVGERVSLADGSCATVASISFEVAPAATGRWRQGQACTGTFGTAADPETGLFVVYNLIVADWHTYFAGQPGTQAFVHNGGACVKPYEVGRYGDLVKRSKGDHLDIDHITSHASNVAREEMRLGRQLSTAEERFLRNDALAVAVPEELHRLSPTYLRRNTRAQIVADAMNPGAARARDVGAMIRNAKAKDKNRAVVAGLKILRCGGAR